MAAMYTDNNEVFVLTRDAFGDYEKVHHRMPVLLEEDEVDLWINTKNSFHEIIDRKILNQQKKIWGEVDHYRCAPHVNSIKEKSEKCLLSLEDYKNQLYQKGLGRFFQKKPKEQDTPQQL
jgi:putative SOS response-associated peptidase YedK